jgi:hypothetical protein
MQTARCLVCGTALDAPPLLCSWRCADAATAEISRNAARSRRIRRCSPDDDLRYQLALRNGQLTAALMTLPKRFARAAQAHPSPAARASPTNEEAVR